MARKSKRYALKSDALIKKRIVILLVLFSLLVIVLIARVGYWQIYKADWLKELAQEQWTRKINIFADRGDILDTNGNPLAISKNCYTVVLQPTLLKKQSEKVSNSEESAAAYYETLSNDLANILGISPDDVMSATAKNESQVILKRNVSDSQADAVRLLTYNYIIVKEGVSEEKSVDYSGILINDDVAREYPMGSFLTQVLGFTSVDGIGLEGIESRYNAYLKGTNGILKVETDRDGVKIADSIEERTEPIDGNDLQLTIDVTLQSFAESALDKCISEQNPESAICIVMDPNTGAVLAMATKPDYDNNLPPRDDIVLLRELTRNKAVANTYEPGAIFKLITTAAAIDSGITNIDSVYDCPGYRVIDGQKINCWTPDAHGRLDLAQALQNSCNTAFIDMAIDMNTDIFYDYIYDFGFDVKTGIMLYGEASGSIMAEKYVKKVDLAQIGFGQKISATPLQIISAVSAIVNDGYLMKPYIAEKIISPNGEIIEEYQFEQLRQVITETTSDTMLDLMYQIVEDGTGRNSRIPGYKIGGISGTSQKYDEEGQVIHDQYIASFVAVAPIDNPKLVVLIIADSPQSGAQYGSVAAAPYAKDFLEEALPYINILPNSSIIDTRNLTHVPDLTNMTIEQAKSKLADEGFGCISEGFGGKIVTQIPQAGEMIEKGSNVIVQLEQVNDYSQSFLVEVPDLFGLTPTEAMELLNENNLMMRIVSSGNVVLEQSPAAGTEVYRGSQIAVEFDYFEKEDENSEE